MGIVNKPIYPKIATRFGVQQDNGQSLTTGTEIIPVTNADELIRTPKLVAVSNGASDTTITLTVPPKKRWHVRSLVFERGGSGFMYFYIYDDGSTLNTWSLSTPAGTTGTYMRYDPGVEVVLNPGWQIIGALGSTTTAGTVYLTAYIEEEDVD